MTTYLPSIKRNETQIFLNWHQLSLIYPLQQANRQKRKGMEIEQMIKTSWSMSPVGLDVGLQQISSVGFVRKCLRYIQAYCQHSLNLGEAKNSANNSVLYV